MTAAVLQTGQAPSPGFDDPVHDSQTVFRTVLRAMSSPGEVQDIAVTLDPPGPLAPAAAAVCLALLDLDTRLWIDGGGADTHAAARFITFHTGAPVVPNAGNADFAIIADGAGVPNLNIFEQGTDEAPETGATVIIQVAGLKARGGTGAWRLTGPGINGERNLRIEGVRDLAGDLAANRARFPRGVDIVLCSAGQIAALPRTTKVEV